MAAVPTRTPTHTRHCECAPFGILCDSRHALCSEDGSFEMLKLLLLLLGYGVLVASSIGNDTAEHGSTEEAGHGSEEDRCNTHEPFNSEVHIAKVEFERVQTLFVVTVFIMVVVLAKLGKLAIMNTFIIVDLFNLHSVASQVDASCCL